MILVKHLQQLKLVDRLLLLYTFVTAVFIVVFYNCIQGAVYHIIPRVFLIIAVLYLPLLNKYLHKPITSFFRIAYPLLLISFFYSETDALNNVFFENLDSYFVHCDSVLFGCQPSLAFYNKFPQTWFSELMNFGYFSYYFLILVFAVVVFIKDRISFEKKVFLVTCSFLIYYIIFIIVPVSGPQYFFSSPCNQIADSGIFRSLVKLVEFIGERPTAAFPSSHVGVVLILLILSWPKHRILFFIFLPLFILLLLSTVYIKAHYAIDVIGGLISAPIILWLSTYIWKMFNFKNLKY